MSFHRHLLGAIVLLAGAAASHPAAAIFIDGQFAGQWAEASTPGVRRGLNLQYFKLGPEQGTLFAVGFFFDNEGNQLWFSGNAAVTPELFEFTFPVNLITGGRFAGGPAGDIVQVQNFAQVTLTFNTCNSMDFAWQWSNNGGPDIGSGSVNMDRGVSTVGAPGFVGPERCVYQKQFTACPAFSTAVPGAERSCAISAPRQTPLLGNIVLTNDINWVLNGEVFVGNDNADQSTLTIEPGTRVTAVTDTDAMFFIRRGSKIFAEGKPFAPIVLTGDDPNTESLWGGVVLSGNAGVNGCAPGTQLCELDSEFATGEKYGGNNDTESSGTLRYVNIYSSGVTVETNREVQGLTLQGIGSATALDHIHIHTSSDDGIEFFGGTAQVKYLIITNASDDSFDWGFGWRGKAQHVLAIQASGGGDHGIEADNNEFDNDSEPRANPTLANFTLLGSAQGGEGLRLRRGTAGTIRNFAVTGFGAECLNIDSDATFPLANSGALNMTHSRLDCATQFDNGDFDVASWFNGQEGNSTGPLQLGGNGFQPIPGSPLLDAGADIEGDSFFDTVDYIGAFRSDDPSDNWTLGWTDFVPGNPLGPN